MKESVDEDKFLASVSAIYAQMKKMEQHKYLDPKLSYSFE